VGQSIALPAFINNQRQRNAPYDWREKNQYFLQPSLVYFRDVEETLLVLPVAS